MANRKWNLGAKAMTYHVVQYVTYKEDLPEVDHVLNSLLRYVVFVVFLILVNPIPLLFVIRTFRTLKLAFNYSSICSLVFNIFVIFQYWSK